MKIESVELKNNDAYFMEILGDKIILNDNYKGILILNKEMDLIDKMELIEDITIYSSFKNSNKILLFCPDNECLVYVDINLLSYKIISVTEFNHIMFSAVYYWDDKDIFLSDYQGNLLKVNLDSLSLCIINCNSIEYQSILEKYLKLKELNIIKMYALEKRVLVKSADSKLSLLDYENEVTVLDNVENNEAYDFELMDDYFAHIGENKVSIFFGNIKETYYPSHSYNYLRGKFMCEDGEKYLFLLSGNKINSNNVKLEKYIL